MKGLNSWIRFIVILWVVLSCTISAMLTFEPKDSCAYQYAATHHKGVIALEFEVSTASDKGTYGFSEGYYVAYNRTRKPGSKVLSVFLYNPFTNYEDDIVLAYDSGMLR